MLLLLLLLLHHLSPSAAAGIAFLNHVCSGQNYTTNSTYNSNLNALFTSLSLSSSNSTFANSTSGSSPNRAYGLFLCRGDVSPSDCKTCVQNATKSILSLCHQRKQAIIWYDYCQLRYADARFFSVVNETEFTILILINTGSATSVGSFVNMETTFVNMEAKLLDAVTHRAAYNSSMKFATGVVVDSSIAGVTVYALAQCTRDLSAEGCDRCLQLIRGFYGTYETSVGGRVVGESCIFRCEPMVFFRGKPMISLDLSAKQAAVPAPTEQLASARGRGRGGAGVLRGKSTKKVLLIVIPVVFALLLILVLGIFFRRRSKRRPEETIHGTASTLEYISGVEGLSFDLPMLKVATDNFSNSKKLGQGGFGTVYKGTLASGEEIAVKRLSASSRQGIQELRNELILVAKLQHKNVVRLRGICLEEDEKLLVYEYVPNGSLDNFLFDPVRCKQLNWGKRFNIIWGIARGLLYLHEESHLKVIHRDLKASNVLLDADMNPKIADFGLARLFGEDETQGITNRVVGTFGYMAPEYAQRGHLSMKLDVYSFGILVLEIVTGKRCNGFHYDSEISPDIISYAWEHWRSERALEIIDPALGEISSSNEVLRCIKIGLLCVQDVPTNRPPMLAVFRMLHGPSMPIQDPLQPRSDLNFSEEFARSLHSTDEDRLLHQSRGTRSKESSTGHEFLQADTMSMPVLVTSK